MANTVEELVRKGSEKLGLKDQECRAFNEKDGTEVDEDDVLLSYAKGSIFIIGKEWRAPVELTFASDHTSYVEPVESMGVLEQDVKGSEAVSVEGPEGFLHEVVGSEGADEKEAEIYEVEDDLSGTSWGFEEGASDFGESSYHGECLADVEEVTIGETSEMGDVYVGGEKETKRSLIEEPSLETTAKKRVHDVDVSKQEEMIGLSKKGKSLSTEPSKRNLTDVLMQGRKYKNALIKAIKIDSEAEIQSTKLEMEKKRRRFWNTKAEQLATSPATAQLDKTTLTGIVNVAWTLRKTSFIEDDARKSTHDEKVLFPTEGLET